jgi:hypothetical protein
MQLILKSPVMARYFSDMILRGRATSERLQKNTRITVQRALAEKIAKESAKTTRIQSKDERAKIRQGVLA